MGVSTAPRTGSTKNFAAKRDAAASANLAAFPVGALIAESKVSLRCKKTAEDMRAEMDTWGDVQGVPAYGKVQDDYDEASFGPPLGAFSATIAAEVPASAGPVRVDAPKSKKAAPAPAMETEPGIDAAADAKPEQSADVLALALDALQSGVFGDLDDLTKTEYGAEVVASWHWDTLTIPQKAAVSRVLSPIQMDKDNPKRGKIESAHSLFRKVTEKCKAPAPEVYTAAWSETANVITCRCEAGCRNHDCYHAEQFRQECGDDIRRAYTKVPRLMSEASAMERSMAWLDTNDVRRTEDF